jgi:hypothetical protein
MSNLNTAYTAAQSSRGRKMSLEAKEKTLAKVQEVTMKCPNFFDWDWCNPNCIIWELCSRTYDAQNAEKASKK